MESVKYSVMNSITRVVIVCASTFKGSKQLKAVLLRLASNNGHNFNVKP